MEKLLSQLGSEDEILLADGFDQALIGHASGMQPRAVYDYDRCITVLVQGGMTHEEAVEYFDFNTVGAYVGEQTPVFVRQIDPEDSRALLRKLIFRCSTFLSYVQEKLVDEEQATGIRYRSELANMSGALRKSREFFRETGAEL